MAASNFYQTPGVLTFMDKIIEDIHNHRSVLILLPDYIKEQEFEIFFQERLRLSYYLTQEVVSLPDLSPSRMPSAQLGELFCVTWPEEDSPRTVKNLLSSDYLPDLIYLSRYRELKPEAKKIWIDFLLTWSKTLRRKQDGFISFRPAICLMVPLEESLDMEENSDLSIRSWFGFPSALEVQMVCRFSSDLYERKGKVYGLWYENILPSLVANDIYLKERISPYLTGDYNGLMEELISDAIERGFGEKSLKLEAHNFLENKEKDQLRSTTYLKKTYPLLWSKGVLMSTMEWGVELHISALALLQKKNRIYHRIWRGQLPLILPLIDNLRHFICNSLTQQYGETWPLLLPEINSSYKPPEVPHACELGQIELLFNTQLKKEYAWIPVIRNARKIRNDLAHYQPVLFEDFLSLIQEAYKLGLKTLI